MKNPRITALLASAAVGALIAACASSARIAGEPECVEAELCDGQTKVALATVPTTREEGQAVADTMMAAWKEKNPERDWEQDVRSQHSIAPSYDNSALLDPGQGAGDPGRSFTDRDLLVWKRETERMVAEGARIFHSGDELGSTISVSCDMCHPDAANTHPETYPKYQTQIGRAVLLRDMINWCLEHPVRAKKMAEDDPRMRALEAYIYAQRTGTPLAYGKH
jgi:thiosulfate dehydrogenase